MWQSTVGKESARSRLGREIPVTKEVVSQVMHI
jgi:hypothetical protein